MIDIKIEEQIIEKTIELINIPSFKTDSEENKPFGREIDNALDYYLNLANQLGFKTYKDTNGYFGEVTLGDSDESIGILGHLDVVEAGDLNNWKITQPFEGLVVDNKLYGRGAEDMKLPMVVMLYVMKMIKESDLKLKKNVKLIVGTDEENEFRCMKAYGNEFEFPEFGFTPDGAFPVINIEGSLIQYYASANEQVDFTIFGGSGLNITADWAEYSGSKCEELREYLNSNEIDYKYDSTANKVRVFGHSVHVMDIENGHNAINKLCCALHEIGETCNIIKFIAEQIGTDTTGSAMYGKIEDMYLGNLSLNVGTLEITQNSQSVGIDMRIPVLTDQVILIEITKNILKQYALEYLEYFNDTKVFVDENSDFVQTLLSTYNDVTNTQGKCIATRGGSYSKVAPGYVGFGMNFSQLLQADTAHQADEYYELQYLPLAIEIYYQAISKLIT